jgi:hypothetical protein
LRYCCVVRLHDCCVARLRDCCITRFRDCCVARLRYCCFTRLRDCCIIRLRDFCVARLRDCCNARLRDCLLHYCGAVGKSCLVKFTALECSRVCQHSFNIYIYIVFVPCSTIEVTSLWYILYWVMDLCNGY